MNAALAANVANAALAANAGGRVRVIKVRVAVTNYDGGGISRNFKICASSSSSSFFLDCVREKEKGDYFLGIWNREKKRTGTGKLGSNTNHLS